MKPREDASRSGVHPKDAWSGAVEEESSNWAAQSTATNLGQTERTTMQRKDLPRLDTTIATRTSEPQPAELLSLPSGGRIKDAAASGMVLKPTDPSPVSPPAAQKIANRQMISMAPDQRNVFVSEALQ